jgi:hypothetical protein
MPVDDLRQPAPLAERQPVQINRSPRVAHPDVQRRPSGLGTDDSPGTIR